MKFEQFPETVRPVERKKSSGKLKRAGALGLAAVSITAPGFSSYMVEEDPYNVMPTAQQAYANSDRFIKDLIGYEYCPPPPSPEDTAVFFQEQPIWPEDRSKFDIMPETNLTFVDDPETYSELLDDIKEAKNNNEVVEALSTYTKEEYGITASLDGLDNEDIDQTTLSQNVRLLADNLYFIPKELVAASGITNIEIRPLYDETSGEDKWGAKARFQYDANGSTMVLDINSVASREAIYHEMLGHGLHYTSCGGFAGSSSTKASFRDRAISDNNPDGFIYEPEHKMGPTTDPADLDYFVDEYQKADVREDVAVLTTMILDGELDINDPNLPEPTRQKAAVIIDRIEEQAPGSVAWMRHLNRHNNS